MEGIGGTERNAEWLTRGIGSEERKTQKGIEKMNSSQTIHV